MLDRDDIAFKAAMERELHLILWGDQNVKGLYEVLKASQSWEQFLRLAGQIEAYEAMPKYMENLARAMNGDQRGHQMDRSMN